jgi:hypothetical protein
MYDLVSQHVIGTVLLVAVLLVAAACTARYTVHPGAINTIDSAAYDSLLVAQAAIDQARSQYAAGQIPAKKKALDALIASYNVARASWLTYRGALTTNVPDQTYVDTLNKNLSDLSLAIRNFEEAK